MRGGRWRQDPAPSLPDLARLNGLRVGSRRVRKRETAFTRNSSGNSSPRCLSKGGPCSCRRSRTFCGCGGGAGLLGPGVKVSPKKGSEPGSSIGACSRACRQTGIFFKYAYPAFDALDAQAVGISPTGPVSCSAFLRAGASPRRVSPLATVSPPNALQDHIQNFCCHFAVNPGVG